MHEKPIPDPGESMDRIDSLILEALTVLEETHRPWSIDEIARAVEEDPRDSLGRLAREGLVHRLGDFAWPTRAAARAEQLKL
jgi:hypothetical protein